MEEINVVICPDCGEDNEIKNENCYECSNSLLLNNKYHLLEVLGENIGITYVAIAVGEDLCISPKQVVIKELPIKKVDRWKTEELFKR